MSEENSKNAVVVSVNTSPETGTTKTPVPKIVLNETGIVGDAHAGTWHRQVSLLATESIDRFGASMNRTFAFGEFAENITTRGIDLLASKIGDRLSVGPAELEVTQIGKKCHGGACAIYQQVGQCVMPREGIFCRVLRGGEIKADDAIHHRRRILHCRIITLSDRAYRGEYEDRSGPRVLEFMNTFCETAGWQANILCQVIPDEAVQLESALLAAKAAEMDVAITTGGTGIGPRDITPEVVLKVADKTIPGIMDQVRLSCGERNPNALLSRSVATVMGRTLVYALPGSVKAVDEYMPELLKTFEHALFMIRGLDTH